MKIFDQGTPVPLRNCPADHQVDTVFELGWSRLENGDLLTAAENSDYQILITTDQNLRYQQNLQNRRISVIILLSTSWPRIRKQTEKIISVLDGMTIGDYLEIPIS